MKITDSHIKVTVDCIKDGKEIQIGITNSVKWENDFSHVTEVRMVHDILMSIEDQGYVIKEGTVPRLQVNDVPEKEESKNSTPLKAIDDAFANLFDGNEAIEQLEKKTEQPPVTTTKKSRFRVQ